MPPAVIDTPRPTRLTRPATHPPPLEAGDRLEAREFERLYALMPGVKKAELLEGRVYMPSPVSLSRHARPHSMLNGLCERYAVATPGVDVADNCTLRLDAGNEPQPDLVLFLTPERGGRAFVDDEGFLTGIPELVIEIASSSKSYDLHEKKEVYRRHGIPEYVVYRVDDGVVDWFHLEDGEYVRQEPDFEGLLHSQVFPGFRLDLAALVAADRSRLAATMERGLSSPEHAAFTRHSD